MPQRNLINQILVEILSGTIRYFCIPDQPRDPRTAAARREEYGIKTIGFGHRHDAIKNLLVERVMPKEAVPAF